MKQIFILTILFALFLAACSPTTPVAEQAAVELAATAVPPTPTLDTPRVEAEPEQPTAVPTDLPAIVEEVPTDEPTAEPEPAPTETAVPTVETLPAEEVAEAGGVIYGRTEEGAFFHGDPHAPITMIDYSDFL